MRKSALILIALVLLVGCDSKPAPTPTASQAPSSAAPAPVAAPQTSSVPTGDVQAKLQEIAGKDATNCGDVKSLSADAVGKASDCAMDAAKSKKPFLVSYDMPGLSVGIAASPEGKLFTVQAAEEKGKPAEAKAQPCPSELRIAQSGRVTCMPAGSMGVTPGSGNPHAGGTTAPGTGNPHATAPSKSH